jgi:hypothetical protein
LIIVFNGLSEQKLFAAGTLEIILMNSFISLLYKRAACRRVLITAAQIPFQVKPRGICGGQSDIGAGFLQVLRFPLPVLIAPTAPYSLIILSSTLYNLSINSFVK